MEPSNEMIMSSLKLLGALGLLMFGMKTMSESLQKITGPQLRHVLGAMTSNRFTGLLTGMLVTVAVQSSAATTVMTVSFVNAGLLTLMQAISVIMGANIGTTLSAWIMSAGFSFNISDFVWPAFLIAVLLLYVKRHQNVGSFIFGAAFMFFALGTLSATGKEMDLAHNQALINFFGSFDSGSYGTILLFLLIGTVLTCMVQSSAALMAITMVLCTSGVLPIYQGIALVLGENIGTTITANVVALTSNIQARRAAFAHLFFNVFGVAWVLCVFRPFVDGVCSLVGLDPAAAAQSPARLSFVLAAFHTTFNVTNTLVLIWFIPQIEKLCCKVLKPRDVAEEDDTRLRYIEGGLTATPEIAVLQAQKEIGLFSNRVQRMHGIVRSFVEQPPGDERDKIFERIEKYESITDNMEMEIGKYLEQVSDAHLSDDTKGKIRAMLREIGEIESIGDACYNIARSLKRHRASGSDFPDTLKAKIIEMMTLTDESIAQMNALLNGRKEDFTIERSVEIEKQINAMRNLFREQNIADIDNHIYNFTTGTAFVDIVNECEKLGDYVINVVEARLGKHELPQDTSASWQQTATAAAS